MFESRNTAVSVVQSRTTVYRVQMNSKQFHREKVFFSSSSRLFRRFAEYNIVYTMYNRMEMCHYVSNLVG